MEEFRKKHLEGGHQFATRGELVEMRHDFNDLSDEMAEFRKLISELQVSVTERDAELI